MSDVGPIQHAIIDVVGGTTTQASPIQHSVLDVTGGTTTQVGPVQFARAGEPASSFPILRRADGRGYMVQTR